MQPIELTTSRNEEMQRVEVVPGTKIATNKRVVERCTLHSGNMVNYEAFCRLELIKEMNTGYY